MVLVWHLSSDMRNIFFILPFYEIFSVNVLILLYSQPKDKNQCCSYSLEGWLKHPPKQSFFITCCLLKIFWETNIQENVQVLNGKWSTFIYIAWF